MLRAVIDEPLSIDLKNILWVKFPIKLCKHGFIILQVDYQKQSRVFHGST